MYNPKRKIGDVVYIATRHGVDRDIIKAIKIEGLNHKMTYGFKENSGGYLFNLWGGDGYAWYTSKPLFLTKEEAMVAYKKIKDSEAIEEKEKEAQDIADKEAGLKKEQQELKERKRKLRLSKGAK